MCKLAATGNIRNDHLRAAAIVREVQASSGGRAGRLQGQAGLSLHQVEKLTDPEIFIEVRFFGGRECASIILLQEIPDAIGGGIGKPYGQHGIRELLVQCRLTRSHNFAQDVGFGKMWEQTWSSALARSLGTRAFQVQRGGFGGKTRAIPGRSVRVPGAFPLHS